MPHDLPVQSVLDELGPLGKVWHLPVGQPRGFVLVYLVEVELQRVIIISQYVEAHASGLVALLVHCIVLNDFQKLFESRWLDMNFNKHADHDKLLLLLPTHTTV